VNEDHVVNEIEQQIAQEEEEKKQVNQTAT
jgi:hypothetical protein